mmetsp:Transcript_23296/g.22888  ORF Transcript_23296/g.22888 Transcript_23296/m.22888 type:complete len:87 (+) Transcript_23296:1463-1723(+)
MKMIMQYINGAALASSWIFFEHLDRLRFIIFQTLNKEVQMVQQQFIIQELSGATKQESIPKESKERQVNKSIKIRKNNKKMVEQSK